MRKKIILSRKTSFVAWALQVFSVWKCTNSSKECLLHVHSHKKGPRSAGKTPADTSLSWEKGKIPAGGLAPGQVHVSMTRCLTDMSGGHSGANDFRTSLLWYRSHPSCAVLTVRALSLPHTHTQKWALIFTSSLSMGRCSSEALSF